MREIVEAFGLTPIVRCPISPARSTGTSRSDFTPHHDRRHHRRRDPHAWAAPRWTIAIGEQMREAAEAWRRRPAFRSGCSTGSPGLRPTTPSCAFLANISGKPVPNKIPPPAQPAGRRDARWPFLLRRQEDRHRRRAGSAVQRVGWLAEMGCEIAAAVTTTQSPHARKGAGGRSADRRSGRSGNSAPGGCDLLITHCARPADGGTARHPVVPRMGCRPSTGWVRRIGSSVGYRGTRDLIFEIGNMFMAEGHEPTPADWRLPRGDSHDGAAVTAH